MQCLLNLITVGVDRRITVGVGTAAHRGANDTVTGRHTQQQLFDVVCIVQSRGDLVLCERSFHRDLFQLGLDKLELTLFGHRNIVHMDGPMDQDFGRVLGGLVQLLNRTDQHLRQRFELLLRELQIA